MAFSSSTVFAIVICVFGSLEMASAWRPNCIPGDIYLDSTGSPSIPAGTSCKYCEDWCDALCSILGLPPVKYGCRLERDIRCRCCCGSSPPSSSSPPSEPLPPPAPQSPDEFEGRWPQMYDICAAGQRYFDLNHKNGTECIHAPKCEQECKDKGMVMARKECVAGGYTYPRAWYEWYEQCCCETPSPPAPSLSPPPPSPSGDTCQLELSIQITPDQAPRNYKLAQSEY